jgi:hypothetical protein
MSANEKYMSKLAVYNHQEKIRILGFSKLFPFPTAAAVEVSDLTVGLACD